MMKRTGMKYCFLAASVVGALLLWGTYAEAAEIATETELIQPAEVVVEQPEQTVLEQEQPEQPYVYMFGEEAIHTSVVDGVEYLFLPSGARLPDLDENKCIQGTEIHVMRSANIGSLYFYSANPAEEPRSFVEASKKNATTGSVVLKSAKGKTVYRGEVSQIKGRGNSTWAGEKKPYQIKLTEAFDLIETGNSANKAKTWVLLANAFDPTLIHNLVVYKTATAMGLDSPDCRPVDFYYDGEYRGNYLLCEKVETGAGRVNIDENGFLLEMDSAYYADEDTWFTDSINTPFVVKAPDSCSEEQLAYIRNYMQEALDAAANGGAHPVTGKNVWEYIDRTSLMKYYLIQEATKNADAFCSSTYFYLPADGSPMIAGPVWDFDDSFGIREDVSSPEDYRTITGWMSVFLNLPDFRQDVKAYQKKTFSSILSKTTGDGTWKGMWSIGYATKMTDASAAMDHVIWGHLPATYLTYPTREENIAYFTEFVAARKKWMDQEIARW